MKPTTGLKTLIFNNHYRLLYVLRMQHKILKTSTDLPINIRKKYVNIENLSFVFRTTWECVTDYLFTTLACKICKNLLKALRLRRQEHIFHLSYFLAAKLKKKNITFPTLIVCQYIAISLIVINSFCYNLNLEAKS